MRLNLKFFAACIGFSLIICINGEHKYESTTTISEYFENLKWATVPNVDPLQKRFINEFNIETNPKEAGPFPFPNGDGTRCVVDTKYLSFEYRGVTGCRRYWGIDMLRAALTRDIQDSDPDVKTTIIFLAPDSDIFQQDEQLRELANTLHKIVPTCFNLVTVLMDYNAYALEYWTGMLCAQAVGKAVGEVVKSLPYRADVSYIGIGAGVGVETIGFIGKQKKLDYILSMDGTSLGIANHDHLMNKNDATRVDAIHTFGPSGTTVFEGHSNIFAGSIKDPQVGCETLLCSHTRAIEFTLRGIKSIITEERPDIVACTKGDFLSCKQRNYEERDYLGANILRFIASKNPQLPPAATYWADNKLPHPEKSIFYY